MKRHEGTSNSSNALVCIKVTGDLQSNTAHVSINPVALRIHDLKLGLSDDREAFR
jgi:hypothetical protein